MASLIQQHNLYNLADELFVNIDGGIRLLSGSTNTLSE